MYYNKLKNDIQLTRRDNEARELEFQYSTKNEERKIDQLKLISANNKNTINMYITIVTLIIITIILIWILFYFFKRRMKHHFALLKAEKEEAKLNLKIKEQQIVKAQVEKYDVLSDYRLKEMELKVKNSDLEKLIKDKDDIERKLEEYVTKINEYESNNDQKETENPDSTEEIDTIMQNAIVEDVSKLIRKRLPDKKYYIKDLEHIDYSFIPTLKKTYNGNLSITYIKYCVCFAIGLDISDISECFSIEQSSVHMVRYRLKKKFGLNNDDDLDVYLRRINKKFDK